MPTQRLKTILMISYAFPPRGGSGVQRSLYFAKHLPAFGFRPIIIQGAASSGGGPVDSTLLKEISPETPRFEFPAFEIAHMATRLGRWLEKGGRLGSGLAWRLKNAAVGIENRLSPDGLIFWARQVFPRALHLIKRFKPDVIYSTADPLSNHYLAWMLKRHTGLPWVADFRDLWTQDWGYTFGSRHKQRSDMAWERRFLSDADAIINVSPGYDRVMRSLIPSHLWPRFHVITNGVDLSSFPPRVVPNNARFTLSYVGVWYASRSSDALLKSIARINATAGERGIRLEVAGRIANESRSGMEALGDAFRFHGYVSHKDAMQMMSRSDALLVIGIRGRNYDGVLPGKLFECLASGRPLLYLAPGEGDCFKIIERLHAGVFAPMDSEDCIYKGLSLLHNKWLLGEPLEGARRDALKEFDRYELTGKLAMLLRGVLSVQGDRGAGGC